MTFNQKLKIVAESMHDEYALMGSRWGKGESEYIAFETIKACAFNLRERGEAFSWQGKNTLATYGNGLVDNKKGMRVLLNSGDLISEPYHGNATAPAGTVLSEDGKPMVFRCTEKLLDYAIEFLKLDTNLEVGII